MITQAVDPHQFIRKARQIRAQMPILLSQWGLLPKFKRWRLAQDPGTGMVVLFGVLNNKYIASHTTTPFSDYFDPRLIRDLTTELHVPVISSANDGLRYAFVLEKGQLGLLSVPVELSVNDSLDQSGLVEDQRVLKESVISLRAPNRSILAGEPTILHQRLEKFLKLTEALDTLNDASPQPLPDVLLMAEAEFSQRLAEYEATRNHNHLQTPLQQVDTN